MIGVVHFTLLCCPSGVMFDNEREDAENKESVESRVCNEMLSAHEFQQECTTILDFCFSSQNLCQQTAE